MCRVHFILTPIHTRNEQAVGPCTWHEVDGVGFGLTSTLTEPIRGESSGSIVYQNMVVPPVDPRASMQRRKQSKEQAKKLKFYAGIAVGVIVLMVWFFYAEMEASKQRAWADNYERKCEACQTMIVSGIWTRSLYVHFLS